jgi:enolase
MSSPRITGIRAREVLDCRGLPTVQVDVTVAGSGGPAVTGRADVPSGRSTGEHEAVEIRDGGKRFGGFGVQKAVAAVNGEIAGALVGEPLGAQRLLDAALCELDGTPNKARLGANALLGVSLAGARAAAAVHDLPLYRFLNADAHVLPVPLVNLINGGKHASGQLEFQEFIVMPVGASSMLEALATSTEINLALGAILLPRYGKSALNTGDEGGYVPQISDPREALGLLHEAVEAAGCTGDVVYGLDCASSHFYDATTRTYTVAGTKYERDGLIELYLTLIADYDIVTIEDPLEENDFEGFAELTSRTGIQIVGDDLFTTNAARLAQGVAAGAANSLLWKVNQIGTLSEAFDAATAATRAGYTVVVSERSGETEDPIIADLVVALGAGQIKTGAPVRGERTSKYNRLLQIEEELGSAAVYPGRAVVRSTSRPTA